ncbi:ArsR/SmtB family transcription factor [Paenibacillus eucommiae]|uniref:DNA-binding transcriptional ArsR family regulator n=1 Tax=Paenibacillus eucommiae TaxID=1355755 RepID=A0ABS4J4W4_9BACL|nr:metalloregulator ArsR/SmtB family transcription factor [Paenibacillus eucommiae]MBP1994879.1 DNA-binding transcriptional ArsR family regulator [Paenibacillus eucommiae]
MSTEPIFAALGDPFRRKLLENLAENSPKTATQLAELYPLTRQGILKHLNVLEDAGLVEVQQQGREKRYFLTPAPLGELERWVQAIGGKWDERLQLLKGMIENENIIE